MQRQTVRSGELDIAILDWGTPARTELAPLFFAHATGFCAGIWSEIAEAFAATRRVIAYDQRGHGDSSKPEDPAAYEWEHLGTDVIAVLDALGIDRVDAVGHSSGAAAIVLAASRHPDRFDRLVLIEPIIAPPPSPETTALLGHPNPLVEGAVRRRMVFDSRADMLERFGSKPPMDAWSSAVLSDYVEFGSRERADGTAELKCPGHLEAEMYRQGAQHRGYDALTELRTPSLLLGTDSPTSPFPVHWWENLADRIPDSHFEKLAGLGHFAPMQDPELIVDVVAGFLDDDKTARREL